MQDAASSKVLTKAEELDFLQSLCGLPISGVWRGYAATLFLELGKLHYKEDASHQYHSAPVGDYTIMIEVGWKMTGVTFSINSMTSAYSEIDAAIGHLRGTTVLTVQRIQENKETKIITSSDQTITILESTTTLGWTIFNRYDPSTKWISFDNGKPAERQVANSL